MRFHRSVKSCSHCGCPIEERDGDCWGFMYMSMAALVGVMVAIMWIFPARNIFAGQIVVLAAAFAVLVLTLPHRKGMAIAIDILVDPRYRRPDP